MTLPDMRDKHDRLVAAVARNKREHKSTAVLLSRLQAVMTKMLRAENRQDKKLGFNSKPRTTPSHAQQSTVAR